MQPHNKIAKYEIGAMLLPLVLAVCAASSNGQQPLGGQVLRDVADVPMPGPAVRFDCQNLDVEHGRLYIAHMNADQLVVFDTQKGLVIANLDGFKRVHGVIAVPEIGRVYASVTGEHQVAAVDMSSLKTICDERSGELSRRAGVFTSDEAGFCFG